MESSVILKTSLALLLVLATRPDTTTAGLAVLADQKTSPDSVHPLHTSALYREARSGYPERYGTPRRDLLQRLTAYERQPTKCARCLDDRYADDREYDRYDDDRRRPSHRPTYGSRYDKNDEEDERKGKRNGTDGNEEDRERYGGGGRRPYDDRRNGYDDRRDRYDRNRHDSTYYDRFLPRDPYDRRYDDDDAYGAGGGGRYEYDRRRPAYDDRYDDSYDRTYDDRGHGGYRDRGHDSFRPWDETYRGSAGFDAGGRGYYFASGRPDAGATSGWTRPDYNRPDLGYGSYGRPQDAYDRADPYGGRPYRDPYDREYRPDAYGRPNDLYGRPDAYGRPGVDPYARPAADPYARPAADPYARPAADPYGRPGSEYGRPDGDYARPTGSYGRPGGTGWHDVGEGRLPSGWHSANSGWRDQSSASGGGRGQYGSGGTGSTGYGPTGSHGQTGSSTSGYGQTSTTPGNSYLYEREGDGSVKTTGARDDNTTKTPS